MATPRIGTAAVLNGKKVLWAGENYSWQSPSSFNKLKTQGKFRHGTQELDRLGNSISNNPIAKRLAKAQQDFRKATDKIPGIQQLERAANNASTTRLPSQVPAEGAAIIAQRLGQYLNVDPRLALLGSVAVGKVGHKPNFTGKLPKAPKANLPAPKPVGRTNLDNLPKDVYRDAFGAGSRQFGAYPRDVAEQRAFSEGMQPVPGGTGTAGRPSAKASSPALKELATGVRKQTGQQRIRDRLNQSRQGEQPPRGSKPPTPKPLPKLTPEQRTEVQRLKEASEQLATLQAGSKLKAATRQTPSAYTDLNKPSLGEKSTKAIERRLTDPRVQPEPVRKDSQGNIIKPPKAERNKPSTSQDAIKSRLEGYQGYKGKGATQANSNRSGVVKQPTSQSKGRHFQSDGELSGIKQERPADSGRSQASKNQTLKTLKSMLDKAIFSDNQDKVRSIKALIKRLSQ